MADLPAIGLRVPQYGSSWDAIRDAALRIEALGFDSLWVNDHLQSPGRVKRDPTFDAFTTLAAIAPLTERVRLGTVVMSASYRPPPVAAKMATVIDVISGGRFILGLGSGSNVPEHRAYGIPFPAPAERTERLSAALTTIRAMFRGEEGAPPNVPPSPRPGGPPIWLAAHKPRLLRMAGERADGIVAAFVGPGEAGRRLRVARAGRCWRPRWVARRWRRRRCAAAARAGRRGRRGPPGAVPARPGASSCPRPRRPALRACCCCPCCR
jgi:alkanesulfonate monooxygenase SsuD/methylene tetrahydromethanopterin reductase-like flavin-dependent oxidoreductase (luciferase family)